MTEPDVTLTNFVIVVECLAFVWACARRPRTALRGIFVAFFAASALASGSAGVVHGFLPVGGDPGHAWTITMLAIIVASAALALAAGELSDSPAPGRALRTRVIALAAACIATAVLLGWRNFTVAVAVYVPASLWLASALFMRWRNRRSMQLLVGAAGLLLAIFASTLQQIRYTPVPEILSHNAWYHVLQIVAFAAFFAGCRNVLTERNADSLHARSS